MKAGVVVGGVILLLLGVAGFLFSMNGIAEYQTALGQTSRAISEGHRQEYAYLQYIQIGGALFGVIGLAMTIAGAAKK